MVLNTKIGRIALGGRGNDIYQGEYILIIDVGGKDKYLLPERTKADAKNHPVQVIIDWGGDDVYLAGNYSLGGAIFGTNLLMDLDGDYMQRLIESFLKLRLIHQDMEQQGLRLQT